MTFQILLEQAMYQKDWQKREKNLNILCYKEL